MRLRQVTKRTIEQFATMVLFGAIWACATFTLLYGQKGGSAAKGGSPVRELVKSDVEQTTRPARNYSAIAQELGFNYETLSSRIGAGKPTGNKGFTKVLLIYLITRDLTPTNIDQNAERVLAHLRGGNSLDKSLQVVFVIPLDTAKKHRRAAERELKLAAQKTRGT